MRSRDVTPEELALYFERVSRLLAISGIDLHLEEIIGADKTVDVVVEIFNRVNSGGTKLSRGDLTLLESVRIGLRLVTR